MSDAYVIEMHGKTVGLIVKYPGPEVGFRFIASDPAFNSLEGEIYTGALHAERAARDFAKGLAPATSPKKLPRAA